MILCIGLSPTVQRTLFFDHFSPEQVNRAKETQITASGKAVNVARVISILGGAPHLVQIVGGDSGRFVAHSLERQGIANTSVPVQNDAATRTCVTILSPGQAPTELVEEVPPITDLDIAAIRSAARPLLPHSRALCLSGSFPPGVPVRFYADLVHEANSLGVLSFVDAQKAPLLEALGEKPFLVKPNLDEAFATLGLTRSDDDQADASTAVVALQEAGSTWALVSMGKAGSLLGGEGRMWHINPPQVDAVNPIGSGDSLTAGLVYAHIRQGKPIPEAVVFGTACAAANCLSLTSGVVEPRDVERFLPQVQIRPL
ncbi:MAG: 1-phosphofructokinase family hexose kinase [Armatimonadota bacterium]